MDFTAFTLLQDAASAVGITLPEPNAGLGSSTKLAQAATRHGFTVRDVINDIYNEPLTGDPDEVFSHYLEQGLAEPLRRVDQAVRRTAMRAYRQSYRTATDSGRGAQHLLFASFDTSI